MWKGIPAGRRPGVPAHAELGFDQVIWKWFQVAPCQTTVPSLALTVGLIHGLSDCEYVQSVVTAGSLLRKSIVRLDAATELGLIMSQLCIVSMVRPTLVASRPKARSLMWRR